MFDGLEQKMVSTALHKRFVAAFLTDFFPLRLLLFSEQGRHALF